MDRLDCDRMFVAVAENGSFAAAAARIGTSTGQASKLVSRLEAELGVQLLSRTTRALSLTEAGRGYLEGIKPLLSDYEALDTVVRHTSGAPSGRLRISAPITFGTSQLVPVLIKFACQYSEIQLDVNFSDRNVNLVDEGFDAAIRVGRPLDSSLIARKLCESRVVIAASPDYLATRGTPKTPAELEGHDCIIDTNFHEPFRWQFRDADGSTETVMMRGRLQFSNAEACLAATLAGFGIARLPSFIAGPKMRDGSLRVLLAERGYDDFGIYALYPPGRHLALKVRVMVDFLTAAFKGRPEWDKGW